MKVIYLNPSTKAKIATTSPQIPNPKSNTPTTKFIMDNGEVIVQKFALFALAVIVIGVILLFLAGISLVANMLSFWTIVYIHLIIYLLGLPFIIGSGGMFLILLLPILAISAGVCLGFKVTGHAIQRFLYPPQYPSRSETYLHPDVRDFVRNNPKYYG